VKFRSTGGISPGDTLFLPSGSSLTPALKVTNLSSTSCVGTLLRGINLSVADIIIAKIKADSTRLKEQRDNEGVKSPVNEMHTDTIASVESLGSESKQNIKGSISVNSYSDFSDTPAPNSNRLRYTLTLNARDLAGTRFSAESYLSFKHKAGEWNNVNNNIFNALKIYSLNGTFRMNRSTLFILGRKINPRIANIGAMDGLQAERSIGSFTIGAAAGSRPDYKNYGFAPGLLQYGAYLAFDHPGKGSFSQSSLAVMQQMNHTKTDRRFLYLQHSGYLLKNLNFTGTCEIDLFKLDSNTPRNTFDLTGLFLSLRYKIIKDLTLTGSYDARKNVIYYETYRNSTDSLIENELRQGFRLQAYYRITRDISLGIQTGYRHLSADPVPSKNLYSYLTFSQVPGLGISSTLSATLLESGHMNGRILGMNISRDLLRSELQAGLGYRYVDYRLPENLLDITQNIGEMYLTWIISNGISFSASYEGVFEAKDSYNRIYLQLRKRF